MVEATPTAVLDATDAKNAVVPTAASAIPSAPTTPREVLHNALKRWWRTGPKQRLSRSKVDDEVPLPVTSTGGTGTGTFPAIDREQERSGLPDTGAVTAGDPPVAAASDGPNAPTEVTVAGIAPRVATGGTGTRLEFTEAAPAAAKRDADGRSPSDPAQVEEQSGVPVPMHAQVEEQSGVPVPMQPTGAADAEDSAAVPLAMTGTGAGGTPATPPSSLALSSPQVGTGAKNVHSSTSLPQNRGNPLHFFPGTPDPLNRVTNAGI